MKLNNLIPDTLPDADPALEPEFQLFNLSLVRNALNRNEPTVAHFWQTVPVLENGVPVGDRYVTNTEFPTKKITARYEWRDHPAVPEVAAQGEEGEEGYVPAVPAVPAVKKATWMRTALLYSKLVAPDDGPDPRQHQAHLAVKASFVGMAQVINAGLAALSPEGREAVLAEAVLPPAAYPLATVEGLTGVQVGVLYLPAADYVG